MSKNGFLYDGGSVLQTRYLCLKDASSFETIPELTHFWYFDMTSQLCASK